MIRAAGGLVLLAALAGCGDAPPGEGGPAASEPIWCGLDGATELARDCTLERGAANGAPTFVVRHPDGKFRRLIASADGRNLLAADGAEQSQSALKADRWEVILGNDRYVVPTRAQADAHDPAR